MSDTVELAESYVRRSSAVVSVVAGDRGDDGDCGNLWLAAGKPLAKNTNCAAVAGNSMKLQMSHEKEGVVAVGVEAVEVKAAEVVEVAEAEIAEEVEVEAKAEGTTCWYRRSF